MALNYDFDIHSILPDEVRRNSPKGFAMARDLGVAGRSIANKQPLFRDPKTVEALSEAPLVVQSLVGEMGFGPGTMESGAPSGTYPICDHEARLHFVGKLMESPYLEPAMQFTTPFNVKEFVEAAKSAYPVHARSSRNGKKLNWEKSRTLKSVAEMSGEVVEERQGMSIFVLFGLALSVVTYNMAPMFGL